jgi:hypothetical protein
VAMCVSRFRNCVCTDRDRTAARVRNGGAKSRGG